MAALPASLREVPEYISPEEQAKLPPYVTQLRHFLQISCAHKRLVIHRAFLNHLTSVNTTRAKSEPFYADVNETHFTPCKSSAFSASSCSVHSPQKPGQRRCEGTHPNLSRPSAMRSKQICIELARQITREIVHSASAFEQRPTWSTPYIAVGAITLLSLDLLEMCAMRSSSSKQKNKRCTRSESHGIEFLDTRRPNKVIKLHPDQSSNQHAGIGAGPSDNQAEKVSGIQDSTTPKTLTDEEIGQETEIRRRELEQGLAVLQRLSRWSPIAQRGVTLVKSLLNQKDPLNTLITCEKNRIESDLSGNRSPLSPTITHSLTALTTKIVSTQELKRNEEKEARSTAVTRKSNLSGQANKAGT